MRRKGRAYFVKLTDTLVYALYECELTWKYITESFQLIDRKSTVDILLKVEAIFFGAEDPALNMIFLLLTKCIFTGRTFHNGQISLYLLVNKVGKRIKLDYQNMSLGRFNERWSRFQNLVECSLPSS